MKPHYQRRRFFRPARRTSLWQVLRRYQVLELLGFTGAITAVWLGAQIDNGRKPWTAPEPAGIESASTDLGGGMPIGEGRSL